MEGKNKPDNLERFFQRVLGEYEEDPGEAFWDRIAPNIPAKPTYQTFVYKGWMIALAFLGGLLLSSTFFYWQSNSQLLNNLEAQIVEKNTQIEGLQQQILALQALNDSKAATIATLADKTEILVTKKKEITQPKPVLSPRNIGSPEKAKSNVAFQTEKEPLIKLEIARKTGVVATPSTSEGSWLQPFSSSTLNEFSQTFIKNEKLNSFERTKRLLFDNQLISNSFFVGQSGDFEASSAKEATSPKVPNLNLLTKQKDLAIIFDENNFELSLAEKVALFGKSKQPLDLSIDEDELTSFLSGTINPVSGYKYNLAGYRPNEATIVETTGIISSWNWSVYSGFETKTNWSVQVGIDFNKLVIVKETINNIRFKADEAKAVNGDFIYSFNQRTDGALGQVSVSSTILNQQKNDGQDIRDGDLFKLSISTEQPVKIIRLPILGGYRFDLSKRFYVTPKLGVSAVWKIKDQTHLRQISTFSDRLSIQNSGIFLTTKTTTESLEANFRTEFGFRWRKRWYLVAEPRFKYSGKSLFQYKDFELKDAPFHLMVGIRFNVD